MLTCLSVVSSAGQAQDAELEDIVVTGSRLARPDFDSASPIVSVTEELFERTGSRTVEAALNTLPQFVPAFTGTSDNPSNGGQANVSLRGLGTTSTLVLLDGRRLMPANGTGVADLNVVPPTLIESVEIVTGGASAVYGSDALAGVVNFRLKRDFDGVEIDGTWAQTNRSDGTQYETGLTAGTDFAGGRGSIIGAAAYAERKLVTMTDRDFSKYAIFYVGPGLGTLGPDRSFAPAGNPIIEEGHARFSFDGDNAPSQKAFDALMASYGYAVGSVPPQALFGFNADDTLFTQGWFDFAERGEPAVFNFRGERDPVFFNQTFYTYNFNTDAALQLPLERRSAFVSARFELTNSVRVYAQALYADYSATLQFGSTPATDLLVSVDNPFVPDDLKLLLDSREDPDAPFTLDRRLSELGPRVDEFQYDVYQLTLGLEGSVFAEWQYDAYVQVGANDQTDHQSGNALTSKIEDLTLAPDGGASICGGFDPFGLGSITPECAEYIAVAASNHAAVDQTIVEASLSGRLASWAAGDLRAAFGAFYKEDRYEYSASPVASAILPDGRADTQGFSAARDIRGSDHNVDLYVELLVPLLADTPGVKSLETVLGYRLSDYASAGSVDSWKAELLFQPVDGFRVRGSFQEAVRAASVSELYLPQLPTGFDYVFEFEDGVEPCEAGSVHRNGPHAQRVEALCIAQGVPAGTLPTFQDSDGSAAGVAGGNPDLGAEEATTTTIGVVWTSLMTSPLLANLQVSLDWYRIDISDRISDVPFGVFVANCFDAAYNPDFSVASEWCTWFGRDAESGEIEDVRALLRSAYDWTTDGLDMQLDWSFDLGPGQLGVTWFVGWVDSWTIGVDDSTAPPLELAGTIGSPVVGGSQTLNLGASFPEWKANLHLSYAWRDLTLGGTWRYIDAMTDAAPNVSPAFTIPSANYFDLDAAYEFASGALQGLRLGVGVENLTDEDPPIFPSQVDAGTDPSQYDVLGRRYYLSLRYSF